MRTPLFRTICCYLAAALTPTGLALAQSGGVLSATASQVVINTATPVVFTLAIPVHPDLLPGSVNLQRQSGTAWAVVGRMYDDGTHGDAVAGDNVFSLGLVLNEPALGTERFRSSAGYRGILLRAVSNTLEVAVTTELSLKVDSGTDHVYVTVGSSANVVSTINLAKSTPGTANVQNAVTVAPSGGVTFTSDYPAGGWFASASQTFVLNQSFTGVAVGDYTVTNTATVAGQAVSDSDSVVVHVLPVGGDPMIFPLGAVPDAIPVGATTPVLFTAQIANHASSPAQLDLRLIDGSLNPIIGQLLDGGLNGDLVAGDGVFTGLIPVTATAPGVVRFRAVGAFPGVAGEKTSGEFQLVASSLPTELAVSDMTRVVFDTESQQQFLCDEVLVKFSSPMSDAEIIAFASSFGASVVGSIPGLGIYQLRISNPNCLADTVLDTIEAMELVSGVAFAVPNVIGTIVEMTPNDPSYASQYAPQKIRADEAWVIARGGPVIAIIDTGVDYNHEDLTGRVVKGPDLVNGDADPMDDHGHGTHCAGIAAGSGNNGKGIAGIAWNSPILAIKVANASGNITMANGAASIKKAADLGAKVISCSWGWTPTVLNTIGAWLRGMEDAVNYAVAKGCVVVVAAGNEGSTAVRLPGRYASAFCVGSTTSTDSRSSFSCFGPQVDIAAPGSLILSTLNGGGYGNMSGTSMATPCVAGAAAVLWSRFPAYTASEVIGRLQRTAVELPGLQLGSGRVDLFEAVFNGSFEDGTTGWNVTGTAGAVAALGPLTPTDRKSFGFASSGPDNSVVQTTLAQSFQVQPGVTQFKIAFDYNFVTEEYPEWVNRGFNDNMRITLVKPDGSTVQLAFEDVDHSAYSLVGGINFPGGDSTTGQTGWKSVSQTEAITAGPGTYRIIVRDEGDGIYDSNVLIDRIRFK